MSRRAVVVVGPWPDGAGAAVEPRPRTRLGPDRMAAAIVVLVPVSVAAGVFLRSPLVAVAGPLVMLLARAEQRRRRRRRSEAERAEALPAAVDHLIQQLRSGASLRQACGSLGGDRGPGSVPGGGPPPLAALVDALASGSTLADGARVLTGDRDRSVHLVGMTLEVLAANGGPAVPALQRLRHTLMGRVHRRRRAEAQAAQALASAGLLVAAPVVFAIVLAVAEPALARFYLREPLGAVCGTAALLLSGMGWWWMQRIVAANGGGLS